MNAYKHIWTDEQFISEQNKAPDLYLKCLSFEKQNK